MIRLNYGCDKRVCYCVFIFVFGYCSFLVNYSVGLEKSCLRVNRGLSQTASEKDIMSDTKVQFLKRPSTDFHKKTFLESAHHQQPRQIEPDFRIFCTTICDFDETWSIGFF